MIDISKSQSVEGKLWVVPIPRGTIEHEAALHLADRVSDFLAARWGTNGQGDEVFIFDREGMREWHMTRILWRAETNRAMRAALVALEQIGREVYESELSVCTTCGDELPLHLLYGDDGLCYTCEQSRLERVAESHICPECGDDMRAGGHMIQRDADYWVCHPEPHYDRDVDERH